MQSARHGPAYLTGPLPLPSKSQPFRAFRNSLPSTVRWNTRILLEPEGLFQGNLRDFTHESGSSSGHWGKKTAMSAANHCPAVLLPTEILAEIFIICLPNQQSKWDFYRIVGNPRTLRSHEAPLLVANVCRRWREVAVSTPRLWLSLGLGKDGSIDSTGVVLAWISRSQPYPLSFTMNRILPPAQAVEELKSHCDRWSAVEVVIPEGRSRLFNDVRGRLSSLTQLCLELETKCTVESFAEAPRLERLHLISGADSISVLLPWHQLTRLTCEDLTDLECINTLRNCRALIDCDFIGYDTLRSRETILSFPPIMHPYITSFKIYGEATVDALRLLELPSLRIFEMDVEDDCEILISFFARSHCQLESLCLKRIEGQHLIRCLPFLTSLVSLEIRTGHELLDHQLLRRLTYDSTVLPNLRSFDLNLDLRWYDRTVTEGSMRDMILSRCLGVDAPRSARLHTFRLVYQNDGEDDAVLVELAAELKPLVDPKMVEFTISPDSNEW
ncbi:hypothetical protein C8F04DRAFT_1103762 [Mycena alexandri]|uniref:F-box domain-containing protein n=1 Tax=Mycena alexandri TaxID=1745969 RepID=A0AAD6WZV5_9AGAR|nr:hypothetical protein C8F04DRAFT_1103762 [Mycena alexandri]